MHSHNVALPKMNETKPFENQIKIRWSDLDPIGHVRHSVYYDLAAQLRTELFIERGIRIEEMTRAGFGPILFEEKSKFLRELHFGDNLIMNGALSGLRKDNSRFAFRHEIWRNQDTLCATVEVLGAWINLKERKLTLPPPEFLDKLSNLPRHEDFAWLD